MGDPTNVMCSFMRSVRVVMTLVNPGLKYHHPHF